MTVMISLILFELSVMVCMVSTTSQTICPPLRAFCAAVFASVLASRALSALRFTVEVNSSMLAAVSTTAADCSSVRDARSVLPMEICEDAEATYTTDSLIWVISSRSLRFMVAIAALRRPSSSVELASISAVRSPAAIRSATLRL